MTSELLHRPLRRAQLAGRLPRLALYAGTSVLCAAGIGSIVRGHETINERFIAAGPRFDLAAAEYATEFVRIYLTYNLSQSNARTEALSSFTNSTVDSQAGLEPTGSESVRWADAAQEQPRPGGGLLVTVAAQTNTATSPQYLAVPVVRTAGGALALANYPSFVGPPLVAGGYSAPTEESVTNSSLVAMATRVVTNYLADDAQNLQADLAPGAQFTLPTVALTVQHITAVAWVTSSTIEVDVQVANSIGTTFALAYLIGVAQHDRWYATSLSVNPAAT